VAEFDAAAKLKKKFVTPARDVSLESYGQSNEAGDAASEVVDTDPGLFESPDGETDGDAAATDAGGDASGSAD
jgi:hypothetical protein